VWPWILQLGTGRAGWYSYDLFDNAARPSADRILPQFQAIRVGDWVPMSATVNETTAFKVTAFEANRWLLWVKPDSTWAWQLTPIDGGDTRLVTRLKERYPWRASPGLALLTMVMFEFGDFPMMRQLLLGIRRRAEQHTSHRARRCNHDRAGQGHEEPRRHGTLAGVGRAARWRPASAASATCRPTYDGVCLPDLLCRKVQVGNWFSPARISSSVRSG
jgi:hypothetical protein